MKRLKRFLGAAARITILCLAVLAIGTGAGAAKKEAPEAAFLRGAAAYDQGRYDEAVQIFASLAGSGLVNPRLYYDLGNAYFMAGKLGSAILWYERATRLAPDDPELAFNLARADERMKDAREDGGGAMARIVFFLYGTLSQNSLAWWALVLGAAFWGALAMLRLRRRVGFAARYERAVKGAALAALAGCVLFGSSAGYAWYAAAWDPTGVVLPDELPVRSGKSADTATLFTLHAGTRVAVDAVEDGWTRIRFGRDKLGWAPADAVGPVGELPKNNDD